MLLGRGEHDPLVTTAEHAAFGVPTFDVAGAAHSAHVERPDELARIVLSAALSLETLDLSELEAALADVELALSEHVPALHELGKVPAAR